MMKVARRSTRSTGHSTPYFSEMARDSSPMRRNCRPSSTAKRQLRSALSTEMPMSSAFSWVMRS
jgi:hypothetical protein